MLFSVTVVNIIRPLFIVTRHFFEQDSLILIISRFIYPIPAVTELSIVKFSTAKEAALLPSFASLQWNYILYFEKRCYDSSSYFYWKIICRYMILDLIVSMKYKRTDSFGSTFHWFQLYWILFSSSLISDNFVKLSFLGTSWCISEKL